MNNVWTQNKVVTVNGVAYETSITVVRRIELNTLKWFITYTVNGVTYPTYYRYAAHTMYRHHWYIPSINEAFISGEMGIDRVIDKLQKYQDASKAIVLYTPPVTYNPAPVQPVIAADDAYRQRLHNETIELTHVAYKPMGKLVKWDAIGMFDGKQVHFNIFPEHARLFLQAGQAPLPREGSKDIPHIDVVLAWNEHHNDLRISGVFASNGKLHTLDTALPVAAPTEDTRTEFQKKIGAKGPYAGFDFSKYDKGYKKTG